MMDLMDLSITVSIKKKRSFALIKFSYLHLCSCHFRYFDVSFFIAPSKPKDDWSVAPGVNNSGWGEPRRDGPGGAIGTRNGTDVNAVGRNDQGSWNTPAPIRPSGSGPSGNQWNSGIPPPSRGAGGWDHDSPPISRRDDGTSYWGREKPPGAPGAPPVGGGMGGKKTSIFN